MRRSRSSSPPAGRPPPDRSLTKLLMASNTFRSSTISPASTIYGRAGGLQPGSGRFCPTLNDSDGCGTMAATSSASPGNNDKGAADEQAIYQLYRSRDDERRHA